MLGDMKKEMPNKFIEQARVVLERLEEAGYAAYLVGGYVREMLKNELLPAMEGAAEVTDIDIATSAMPEQVRTVFADLAVIDTGLQHGTVTIMVPDPVEVTTFRVDGDYSDGRHPDSVRFVSSVEEDLARRDFTINAMAIDLRGTLIDPYGGREDLAMGLIRTVGDPEERFREDGLRILRGLRFASVSGYEIEEKTARALHEQKDLLRGIAAERIFVELKKLILGADAGRIIRRNVDVLQVIIPELAGMKGLDQKNPYHRYDVLEHCVRAMEAVETTEENAEYMKLSALLHDVGKPDTMTVDEDGVGHFYEHAHRGEEICRRIMNDLRSDRFTKDRVCTLVKYHDLHFEEDDRLLKRWMNRYGVDVLLEILALKKADNIATGNATDELIHKFDRIRDRIHMLVDEETCFRISDLDLDGRDLIDAGIAEGPAIGHVLDRLLEQVVDGNLPNEKAALIEAARKM